MYHTQVQRLVTQQQSLQEAAQGGDLADVHLPNCLDTMFRHKLEAFLHILFKQPHQGLLHCVWKLERQQEVT